ncbi:MAG: NAD(P)/FAD-dependent oxidoreductase, partial [Actinobacteria bacterium]|nr:NAD(P)/FAD-dependent oxidoreductase [Actinomycetota bacterium]
MSTDPQAAPASTHATAERVDAVVVGAGFSGLYVLYRLRQLGLATVVVEAGDGVGGTWYWNRYPGARVDVVSTTYSYSFDDELQQEWSWTERYATQGEILRYIDHVADRFDLRRDIRIGTRVVSIVLDEETGEWNVSTDRGDLIESRFCVMATGCLSAPRVPDIPGLDRFEGEWFHTGMWPHRVIDFSGRRVGIVGTGSSAIQAIPQLARQASQLTVFQRTPNFSIPAWNAPQDRDFERHVKENYPAFRERARRSPIGDTNEASQVSALDVTPEEREATFERRWREGGFSFLI